MGRFGLRTEGQRRARATGSLRWLRCAIAVVALCALAQGCGSDDDDGGAQIERYCERRCEADSSNTCCKAGTDGCITVSYEPCYEVCVEDNNDHRTTCRSTVDAYTACATSSAWACADGSESPVACDDEFLDLWCCLYPSSDVCP